MTRHDLDGVRQMRRAPGLLDSVFEAVLEELRRSRLVVDAVAWLDDPTDDSMCPFCGAGSWSHTKGCPALVARALTGRV